MNGIDRTETLVCDVCGKVKYIAWNKWSEEVLTVTTKTTTVRMCRDCQNESASFRKNATRYALEKIERSETDDRR